MASRQDDESRSMGGESSRDENGGAQGGNARGRSGRGFASMDRSKQKEIASKGGRAAHAKGTAHEFDSSEAREAGRKGGIAVSKNREHMAAIGRRGGEARGQSRARSANTGSTSGASAQPRTGMSDREVSLGQGASDESRSNTGGLGSRTNTSSNSTSQQAGSRSDDRESFGNR